MSKHRLKIEFSSSSLSNEYRSYSKFDPRIFDKSLEELNSVIMNIKHETNSFTNKSN